MLWYGVTKKTETNCSLNVKKNLEKKSKKNAKVFLRRLNFNQIKFFFYLPINWEFVLFNKTNFLKIIYIYSSVYFFLLPCPNYLLRFKYDLDTSTFVFIFFSKNNYFSLFWHSFRLIFYSFSKIFFKKLKFKGKGYYIYKNIRNTIALQFGYSHIIRCYAFFVYVRFLTKTSIIMFGINYNNITFAGHSLFKFKPINIFTGRGLRFTRQIVYRKTGKISSYR